MNFKCINKKVWIKGYWTFDKLIPRYRKGHFRIIRFPVERIKLINKFQGEEE